MHIIIDLTRPAFIPDIGYLTPPLDLINLIKDSKVSNLKFVYREKIQNLPKSKDAAQFTAFINAPDVY